MSGEVVCKLDFDLIFHTNRIFTKLPYLQFW